MHMYLFSDIAFKVVAIVCSYKPGTVYSKFQVQ